MTKRYNYKVSILTIGSVDESGRILSRLEKSEITERFKVDCVCKIRQDCNRPQIIKQVIAIVDIAEKTFLASAANTPVLIQICSLMCKFDNSIHEWFLSKLQLVEARFRVKPLIWSRVRIVPNGYTRMPAILIHLQCSKELF